MEHSVFDYMADWRIFAVTFLLAVFIMLAGAVGAVLWMCRRGQ